MKLKPYQSPTARRLEAQSQTPLPEANASENAPGREGDRYARFLVSHPLSARS